MPAGHLPDGRGGGSTGVVPIHPQSHRPLARARLVQWMNEKRMKKSPNTDDLSLRSAKESARGAKTVHLGQMTPNCYFWTVEMTCQRPALARALQKRWEYRLQTVNNESNGNPGLLFNRYATPNPCPKRVLVLDDDTPWLKRPP